MIAQDKIPAVAYIRMSNGKQEASPHQQRVEAEKLAGQENCHIVQWYVDEAISGDDTERRLAFLQMRQDAVEKGHFKVVLCWDQDRFGRFDPIEGGYWIKPFRDAGVELITVAQGRVNWNDFAGRLVYLVQQEAKHAYLRDLARNVCRGQRQKAEKGEMVIPCYGYRKVDGVLIVEPTEAAVVRRIFHDYLVAGMSLRALTAKLNSEGVPPPRGESWSMNSVRAILKRQKYCGHFVWGEYNRGRYFATRDGEIVQRHKTDPNVPVSPIVIPDRHEPIIDQATFDQAQEKLRVRRRDTSPLRNGKYVLTGLLYCASCDTTMTGRKCTHSGQRKYICSSYLFRGKQACNSNLIDEAPVLAYIVNMIQERVLAPKTLERLRKAIVGEVKRRRGKPSAKDPRGIQKRIAQLDREIEQGAERVFNAPAELVDTLYRKLGERRQERDRLKGELESRQKPVDAPVGEDDPLVQRALEAAGRLSGAFSKADPSTVRELLPTIIERIDLQFKARPAGKYTRTDFVRGVVELRGDSELSNLFKHTGPRPRRRCRPAAPSDVERDRGLSPRRT